MIGREGRRELNERKIRGFTRGSKQLFFDALEECVIRETVFEKHELSFVYKKKKEKRKKERKGKRIAIKQGK